MTRRTIADGSGTLAAEIRAWYVPFVGLIPKAEVWMLVLPIVENPEKSPVENRPLLMRAPGQRHVADQQARAVGVRRHVRDPDAQRVGPRRRERLGE